MRSKTSADIPACIGLLGEVHASDGYPMHWPRDPRRFIAPLYGREAWVACLREELVGHVALHKPGGDPAIEHACAVTGLPAERLALVARLLVAPTARHQGIGTTLLTTATKEASRHGLRPFLDVAKRYAAAIALFESCGWRRAADMSLKFRDGTTIDAWLYTAPDGDT